MSSRESLAVYQSIPGGQDLLDWFGGPPSFHDAEILSLLLDRSGPSMLKLHGWIMTDRVDDKGYFVLDRYAVVTFLLEEIADLRLEGFTAQNVIRGLRLRRVPLPSTARDLASLHRVGEVIELKLEDCYGLSGSIWTRSVSVRVEPGRP
jgi:hypothetical protein